MTIEAEVQSPLSEIRDDLDYCNQFRQRLSVSLTDRLHEISVGLNKQAGQTLNGTHKPPEQVRMDIIRAVQLHTQLRYDTQIVPDERTADRRPIVRYHTYIPPRELTKKYMSLLNEGDRDKVNERYNRKIQDKSREVFSPGRDFGHLFSEFGEFIRTERPVEMSGFDPVYSYLKELPVENNPDWGETIRTLRHLVFTVDYDNFVEVISSRPESSGR